MLKMARLTHNEAKSISARKFKSQSNQQKKKFRTSKNVDSRANPQSKS